MHPSSLNSKAKRWVEQQIGGNVVASDRSTMLECLKRLLGPLCAGYGHLLETHLLDLLSNRWLCDEHLNACGDYINKNTTRKSAKILSTFFIQNLRNNRAHCSVWTPRKPYEIDKPVTGQQIQTVLIPIHTPGHWSLVVVDIPTHTYSFTDSLDLHCQDAPGDVIPLLNWWLSSILNIEYTLQPVPRTFRAETQHDGYSCGPFVMSTMAELMLSTPSWSSERAGLHRMHWFLTLTESVGHSGETNEVGLGDSVDSVPSSEPESSSDSDSGGEADVQQTVPFESLEPPPPKRLKQMQLPFAPISREEWLLQEKRLKDQLQEDKAFHDELEKEANEIKRLRDREKARLKKQNQRAKKKAGRTQASPGSSNSASEAPVVAEPAQAPSNTFHAAKHLTQGVAELSRPHRHSKKILKAAKSTKNDCIQSNEEKISKRVNWMNPFLWSMIEAAVQAVGYPWRPIDISNHLKTQNPELFSRFSPQRISDWRDLKITDQFVWKQSVLAATAHGNHPQGQIVRHSVLSEYPEIVDTIKRKLTRFRTLGIPLNMTAIRALMIAVIKKDSPDLFKRHLRADKLFSCSYSFVRSFLRKEMNWSFRRPTRAAQATPANMDTVLRRAFLRLACLIRDENIPSCCIVNTDQTQVVYSHGCEYTWTQQGEKQVPVVGKDEKRAYTLVIGVSNSGHALPFQAIYPGLTRASLPHESTPGYAEAQKLGMQFEPSLTKTYWATQATMRSYVTRILVPYFQNQIEVHGLPEDQRCVFQIDAWSVHRSAEFRNWMAATYPWIALQYIPGGCTGYFQACDVALQRVVKAAIRQQALSDLVSETTEAIEHGANIETFKNSNVLKTLRDRSVFWMIQGYKAIKNPELIRKAFLLCAVPNSPFNLSFESLTSHDARKALLALKTSDPEFHHELMMGTLDEPVDGTLEDELSEGDEEIEGSVAEIQGVLMTSLTRSDLSRALADCEPEYESEDDCSPPETRAKDSARVTSRLPSGGIQSNKGLKRKR
ncbi:hypothetical protein FS749_010233 [Ceratobasidium sp. UAMH 11750]|nr:hypothetical protein FS749_010233 [Ceratobasidium sp. UAMH 11750]